MARRPLFDSTDVRKALELATEPAATDGPWVYTSVSTDSRAVEPGALFFALPGERHHGADFLDQAARRGALGAVLPAGREDPALDLEYFPVDEPQRALGDLAAWRRRRAEVRVVGITGSSGKTTVKEMVACALGETRAVHKTAGNLNSLVGLPLSIFQAPPEAEVWVLELGASEPGEIARLTEIASPNDALLTTVGPAHLEAFGSEERVLEEKLALLAGASPQGAAVVGEKPEILPRAARRLRSDIVVAGLERGADWTPEPADAYGIEAERAWFERAGVRYEVPAGGAHHLRDALLAAALADAVGEAPDDVARGLARFRPLGMRSRLERIGSLTVLVDCYNANPESFEAAIEYLATAFPGRRLAAVVGTMLELGEHERRAHREVAERLVGAGFDLVAATGAFAPAAREVSGARNGTRFLVEEEPEAVWDALAASLRGDEVVLVKGSRGVRLERIVERLEARFGDDAPREEP